MYGILLESIRCAIIHSLGDDVWNEILELTEFDGNEINPYSIYSDSIIHQIIEGKLKSL